jgi:predicted RecB family nuclease
MFFKVTVHPRVHRRHPEISDNDAIQAWKNAIAIVNRTYNPPDFYAAAGMDSKGRLLELVGVEMENGSLMIFHAMKLSAKMRKELGL